MIELRPNPFDPLLELGRYQSKLTDKCGAYGATAIFIGTMRDFNEGETVHRLELEHYPGMTEQVLETIVQEAKNHWAVVDVFVLHRVGEVTPSQTLVLIAVWAAHRLEAIEANQFILEALKHRAPFWKKETLDDRSRWVCLNTAGKGSKK